MVVLVLRGELDLVREGLLQHVEVVLGGLLSLADLVELRVRLFDYLQMYQNKICDLFVVLLLVYYLFSCALAFSFRPLRASMMPPLWPL